MPPSPFLSAMKEMAQHLGKKLDAIVDAVKAIKGAFDLSPHFDKQTRTLTGFASRIDDAVKALRNLKVTVDFDNQPLIDALEEVSADIRAVEAPSLDNVEAALTLIHTAIADESAKQQAALTSGLREITATLKALKLTAPASFKLDDMQMRALAAGRSGGGGPLRATRVFTYNVTMANANTEYSKTLPANTLFFEIKLRAQNALLQYAFATGKLPTSGDGANYVTAPQNYVKFTSDVEWGAKTIYFQSPTASQTCEITCYLA